MAEEPMEVTRERRAGIRSREPAEEDSGGVRKELPERIWTLIRETISGWIYSCACIVKRHCFMYSLLRL